MSLVIEASDATQAIAVFSQLIATNEIPFNQDSPVYFILPGNCNQVAIMEISLLGESSENDKGSGELHWMKI